MLSKELQVKKLEVEVAEAGEKIRLLENELERKAHIFDNIGYNYIENALLYISKMLCDELKECENNMAFRKAVNLDESLRHYMYRFEISRAKYIEDNGLQKAFKHGVYLIDAKAGVSIENLYQKAILNVFQNIDLEYGSRDVTECIEIFKQRDVRIENLEDISAEEISLHWVKFSIDEQCKQIKLQEKELAENILKNIFKDLFINYIKFSTLDSNNPAILDISLKEESFNINMSFITLNNADIGFDIILRIQNIVNDINNNGRNNVKFELENNRFNINISFNKNILYKKPWR